MLSKIESFFNLACKHASFLIVFGGIEFILIVTIFLPTYLKSWVFVVSIIIVRFMVDQCPFFFKALVWSNNNTFPFQQHFKLTQWAYMDPWCNSWYFWCYCAKYWLPRGTWIITCILLNKIQLLSSLNWHCAYQIWNLHLNWCCHNQPNVCKFSSPVLHNLKICYFQCNSSQRKELLQLTPHWSNSSL
jgi:hypothetical protein